MQDCETVCDRLTIMVSGVMKCIGSIQHLKKLYGRGFSASIKINDIPDFDEKVATLKQHMTKTFTDQNCTLMDENRVRMGLFFIVPIMPTFLYFV